MTNADKIRLIASKMPWFQQIGTPVWEYWYDEKHIELMATKEKLTPAGASAVREKLRKAEISYELTSWPRTTGADWYDIKLNDPLTKLDIQCGADTEEDATRDAAAQYWSDQ